MSKYALAGGKKNIRRNKSPYGRIVVATLQVIEPGLPVIHIPVITERVQCTERARHGARSRTRAPGIIRVAESFLLPSPCKHQIVYRSHLKIKCKEGIALLVSYLLSMTLTACSILQVICS